MMADIRCPMCGKTNPADNQVCRHCQARLTPLAASGASAGGDDAWVPDWMKSDASSTSGGSDSAAVPDWLSDWRTQDDLSGSAASEPENWEAAPAASEDTPDWLRGILTDETPSAPSSQPSVKAESDWMSRLDTSQPAPAGDTGQQSGWDSGADNLDWLSGGASEPAAPAAQPAGDALPDWWGGLGGETPAGQSDAGPAASTPAGDGSSDWWGSLGAEAAPAQPAETDFTDWLSGGASEPAAPAAAQPAGDALPDWWSSLGGETPAASPDAGPAASTPAGDASSDWWGSLGAEAAPLQPAETDFTDWFSGGASEPAAPVAAQPAGDAMPDWWSSLGGETPAGQSDAASAAPAPAGDASSDWWGSLGAEAAPAEPAAAEFPDWLAGAAGAAAAKAADDALPDWLSSASSETQQAQAELSEFPDWLSGSSSQETAADSAAAQPAGEALPDWWTSAGDEPDLAQAEPSEMPDWLTGAAGAAAVAAAAGPAGEELPDWFSSASVETPPPAVDAEMPDWLSAAGEGDATADALPASDFPDWLSGADAGGVESAAAGSGALQSDDLSWLDEIDGAALGGAVALGAVAALSDSQDQEPDWMAGRLQTAAEQPPEPATGSEQLAQVDLPGWVEAMRPVDVVGGPAELERVEGAGPLAGLRGVLPAEPDITRVEKPPTYSSRLQITEVQQTHAELLRTLVEAEGTPVPAPARAVISSRYVLRLVIAAMLFGAVLLPMILGVPQFTAPDFTTMPLPAAQVLNTIGALPVDAPVLLAVDYNPAYAGELDPLATAALQQLISKGARLTLVSTLPVGQTQAELLMHQLHGEGQAYTSPDHYINLGFIPGGATGLAGFAADPRQAMQNPEAWNTRPLQGVDNLQKFKLVLVAVDNAETARTWVEQLGPRLGDVPLLMLTSAQAGPLVRPYFDTYPRVVDGLISGLGQGASYEVMVGRKQIRDKLWSPFSMGMLVAGLLIAAGGLTNALGGRLARRKQDKAGKEGAL